MPGRLASCSVWQIYSADIAELCAALENLLSAINVGSHEKLKTWELVVRPHIDGGVRPCAEAGRVRLEADVAQGVYEEGSTARARVRRPV